MLRNRAGYVWSIAENGMCSTKRDVRYVLHGSSFLSCHAPGRFERRGGVRLSAQVYRAVSTAKYPSAAISRSTESADNSTLTVK